MDNSILTREVSLQFKSGSGLGTSRLWYAAVLPLLGVFIEMYANSFALGVLVWTLAAVMSCTACFLDYRYIGKQGHHYDSLRPFYALLPPVYIFRRTKLTGDSSVSGAVWCIMLVYALIFNGFSTAAAYKKSDFTAAIKDSSWNALSETKGISSEKTVEQTLSELFADSGGQYAALDWNAEKHSGYITVTCIEKDGSDGAEFRIDFDGYHFGSYHLVSVTENGRELDSSEAAERIKELFPQDESSESSDSADSSETAESTDGETVSETESAGSANNIYSGDLI